MPLAQQKKEQVKQILSLIYSYVGEEGLKYQVKLDPNLVKTAYRELFPQIEQISQGDLEVLKGVDLSLKLLEHYSPYLQQYNFRQVVSPYDPETGQARELPPVEEKEPGFLGKVWEGAGGVAKEVGGVAKEVGGFVKKVLSPTPRGKIGLGGPLPALPTTPIGEGTATMRQAPPNTLLEKLDFLRLPNILRTLTGISPEQSLQENLMYGGNIGLMLLTGQAPQMAKAFPSITLERPYPTPLANVLQKGPSRPERAVSKAAQAQKTQSRWERMPRMEKEIGPSPPTPPTPPSRKAPPTIDIPTEKAGLWPEAGARPPTHPPFLIEELFMPREYPALRPISSFKGKGKMLPERPAHRQYPPWEFPTGPELRVGPGEAIPIPPRPLPPVPEEVARTLKPKVKPAPIPEAKPPAKKEIGELKVKIKEKPETVESIQAKIDKLHSEWEKLPPTDPVRKAKVKESTELLEKRNKLQKQGKGKAKETSQLSFEEKAAKVVKPKPPQTKSGSEEEALTKITAAIHKNRQKIGVPDRLMDQPITDNELYQEGEILKKLITEYQKSLHESTNPETQQFFRQKINDLTTLKDVVEKQRNKLLPKPSQTKLPPEMKATTAKRKSLEEKTLEAIIEGKEKRLAKAQEHLDNATTDSAMDKWDERVSKLEDDISELEATLEELRGTLE